MRPLHAFWVARPPFDVGGLAERFGVTGYSLADALDILVWAGTRIRADRGPIVVFADVGYLRLSTTYHRRFPDRRPSCAV
jgi:hypothetical protein